MSQSLPELAQRREAIAQRIAQLGDLRPGCVTSTSGRCGKPNCRCHQPGEPAHGPHFRLTYKMNGKTISESCPLRRPSTRRSEKSRSSVNSRT